MYKNLIFDLGGVMVDFSPRVFLVDHFMNEALENQLYDITFGSEEWKLLDAGALTRAEANQIMREKGAAVGRSFEVDTVLTDWTDMLRTREDTVRLAKRLKKSGYRIFYLSNVPADVLELMRQRKFFRIFHGGVASCEVHINKPDVRIYKALLQKYRLVPEECLFLDDNAGNAQAAAAAGIIGIHFQTLAQAARAMAGYGIRITR